MIRLRTRTTGSGSGGLPHLRPGLAAIIVAALMLTAFETAPRAVAATQTIWGSAVPTASLATGDANAVTLGTQFLVKSPGKVRAIRVYKGTTVRVGYQGSLWDSAGRRLARVDFKPTKAKGWLEVKLAAPVALRAGQTYTVGYRTPIGRYVYAHDRIGVGRSVSKGALVATAGVYSYADSVPLSSYRNSSYFVDVRFERTASVPNPTPTPVPTPIVIPPSASGELDLPRVPWEGGPAYWQQFRNASKWADPSFFPIGIWFNGISSDAEVAWDKAHGINTYSGMWEGTDFSLFENNDVYWVGGKLNSTFKESSPNWPGVVMDDEVDGRYSPAEGLKVLQKVKNAYAGTGKFMYANYTQLVIGSDLARVDQENYVNFTDAVSLDMYWYSIPFCDWTPYRGELYADPVPQATCRTASSYGRAMNGLTIRDAADGRLQPRWMYVENLNGLSGQAHQGYITPGELKGAAMSSIINEARGLWWFNQSFTGDCQTGSALRQAEVLGSKFCGYAQMQAMGEVNNLIHSLARVLNTQSYQWSFGAGLDTMLKTHDGYAYIFAMTDGMAGQRTFALPKGITGSTAEVVGENRKVSIAAGKMKDSFANEYTYHIYKIKL